MYSAPRNLCVVSATLVPKHASVGRVGPHAESVTRRLPAVLGVWCPLSGRRLQDLPKAPMIRGPPAKATTSTMTPTPTRRHPAQTWWRHYLEQAEGYDARYWSYFLDCWVYLSDSDWEYVYIRDLTYHHFRIWTTSIGHPALMKWDVHRNHMLTIGRIVDGRRSWEAAFYDPTYYR